MLLSAARVIAFLVGASVVVMTAFSALKTFVPISIERSEFDELWSELAAAGWRVNYDSVLLFLAGMTTAPRAPWSSDRGLRYRPPPILVTLGLRRARRRVATAGAPAPPPTRAP